MANETQVSEILPSSGLSDIANEVLSEPGDDLPISDNEAVKAAPKKEAKKEKQKAEGESSTLDVTRDSFGAEKKPPKKAAEEFKLTANGKEYVAKGVEELKAHAQRGIAAQQQMQKMRQEFDDLRGQLQSRLNEVQQKEELAARDPAGWVKKYAKNAEDVMEQVLLDRAREAMAMESMTPRERDLYLANKKYQEELKSREESEKENRGKQEQELIQQQQKILGQMFSKVLTDNKIPANTTSVRIMAAIYRAGLQRGIELEPARLAEMTHKQLEQIHAAYAPNLEEMKADDFVSKYPKLTEAIRKHLLDKVRTSPTEEGDVPRQRGNDGKFQTGSTRKKDEGHDWDRYIKRMVQEGSAIRVKNGW